ncbi:carbamoylphosphate synthase large subunit [Jejuia pallidilutea]|uniref:Carbamoylphosphate synthase large subunit n=1 Tax=Jejuia pallidilutea TaxID=504487 RepID=A0A362X1I0_9FLAO|nr:GNAT family N-acetyltransferase [Jejuia pallidilutea]PQV47682.1 carbamoylphosphate synthase large subunit [Jejuia pallidilutea]
MQLIEDKYKFGCIKVKNEADISIYKQNLSKIKNANIFYSHEYISSLAQKNFIYFILLREDTLIAFMPIYLKKINDYGTCNTSDSDYFDASSPYGYGGPLFCALNSKEENLFFWNKVDQWYKSNNVVTEFIRFNLCENYKHYTGHLIPTLDNVKGELVDFETLWTNFKQKVRNNYRKSLKYNLKAKIYTENIDSDSIEKFHDIYIKSLNRNNAATNYYYTKFYFENLINNNPDDTILVLIFKDDVAISAELILIDNDTLYSHLGGTHAEYFNMRPNDFLKIEVMKWAIEHKKKYYVLGGGRVNGDGLYHYKKSFFPLDKDDVFYTGRKIINQPIYNRLINEINVEYTNALDDIKDSKTFFPLYGERKKTIDEKNTMKQNILFTCAGRRNYLINYFKEALHGDGHIIAVDKELNAPALIDADIAIEVPSIYDDGYISKIKEIVDTYKVTAIISLNDLELPILAKHKNLLENKNTKVIVSSEEVISIGFDKWKTFKFLEEIGLNSPKTYIDLDKAMAAIEAGILKFPLVLKPRWGSGSIGIEIPETLDELLLSYKLQKLKLKRSILKNASEKDINNAILIQEKIEGVEFGLDVVNDFEGNYFGTFAREKLAMRSGETDKAESVIKPAFDEVGQILGSHLKHIGNMDVDAFLVNDTLYILELNLRFGGGYPFSHEAGANIAKVYIDWLNKVDEKEVLKNINYKSGISFSKCDRLLNISQK